MTHGLLIILQISSGVMLLPAVPFAVKVIRQIIALKKGKAYRSGQCFDRQNGTVRVQWTDDEGIAHDKVFQLRPHLNIMYYPRHSHITEVTVYSYKNMSSLGKDSVLGDLFMFLVWIAGIFILWLYMLS